MFQTETIPGTQVRDGAITGSVGKLHFKSLQAPIANHCNLRCKSCSHHAPYLAPYLYDLEQFAKDMKALRQVCSFNALWLVGGEPLLNPRVDDYLAVGRSSGIANFLGVVTNGLLLSKMTDRFFELVDYINLSEYPIIASKRKAIEELLIARSRQFGFSFEMRKTDFFYNIETSELPEADAQRGYDLCQRKMTSPMIHSGFFYKCMRPPTTREYLINRKMCESPVDYATVDGVLLDSINLFEELRDYMSSKEALRSCRFCLFGFIQDSRKGTCYKWLKSKFITNQTLCNIFYSSPVMLKVYHFLDAKLWARNTTAENLVQIHTHEIMSRRECEPR